MTIPTMRETFEEIISASPYEMSVARIPDDPRHFAWPGNYRNLEVQLAWDVLCDVVAKGRAFYADEDSR